LLHIFGRWLGITPADGSLWKHAAEKAGELSALGITAVWFPPAFEAPVKIWFKPLAYALILLREQGYPCVFLGGHGKVIATIRAPDAR